MGKFIKDLYKIIVQHLPEVTLESIIEKVMNNEHIASLTYKFPIKPYIYLTEAFDSEQLTKERKIARNIYRSMLNEVFKNLSQNERDMIGMYKTYGSKASFLYDVDEHRLSSVYHLLDDNNSFIVDTDFGKLKFRFCERKEYNVDEDVLMGYDDELKAIVVFIEDGENITTKDVVDLFLDEGNKHLHELQHYIDDITGNMVHQTYDPSDLEAYLNTIDELKANIQMILGTFGKFLFKNSNKINLDNLKDKNYITKIFNIFIGKMPNLNRYQNVVNKDTQSMFRREIHNLTSENKKEFYDQLYKYTSDYYGTDKDLNFDESRKKQELIRLFRLEETFIYEEDKR